MRISFCRYNLKFSFPAGTSRGVLTEKPTYFIRVSSDEDPSLVGFGEAPYFPGLSRETAAEVEDSLHALSADPSIIYDSSYKLPSSVGFGLQQALRDLHKGGKGLYFDSPFVKGESAITINGLIWMGSYSLMLSRLKEKLEQGFSCIKIKIGAIGWNEELDLLRYIRTNCPSELEIRVDANGGLPEKDTLKYLDQLAELRVHSIEQPIPAGNWKLMAYLCQNSPVPIALDEELIGIPYECRDELLDAVSPQYIILKPALCFGFEGADDWITRASSRGIGWWITSSLESSVGLDALAQYVGSLDVTMPQGLGTGNLYLNNLPSPLLLKGEKLLFQGSPEIFHPFLNSLFS